MSKGVKTYKNKKYNINICIKKWIKKIDLPCNICNKKYVSYKSWWNHDRKFHYKSSDNILKSSDNILKSSDNILKSSDNKIYNCRKCNKIFYNVKTRWLHEQKCKQIETTKINQLEEKNKELENTINEMKKQFSLIIKEK